MLFLLFTFDIGTFSIEAVQHYKICGKNFVRPLSRSFNVAYRPRHNITQTPAEKLTVTMDRSLVAVGSARETGIYKL